MPTNATIQQLFFEELQDREALSLAQDYANEYLDEVFDRNIFPSEEALANLVHFEEPFPTTYSPAKEVITQLHQFGSPASMAQIGGRYFGFVNGSLTPAGLAAKILASHWDQNTAMDVISPISGKLEKLVEGWLKEIFHLPQETVAGFVSGTSTANICGLAAARYRLLQRQGWDVNTQGLFGAPRIRVICGAHAHSSVIKAINILGFGHGNIEWVPCDDQGRVLPESLPDLDANSLLILQAGNVNSGSFDPFAPILEKAKAAQAWVHIDGAFGLWAAAAKELKKLCDGIELANSWAVDGHKTLNTPYDCGIVMCSDPEAIVSALHMSASYLMLSENRDGMFYTPEMSRRSRIIELWATLKTLGKKGLDEMVLGMHQRAQEFADLLSTSEGFEVLNNVVFNQVIVQCKNDELTQKVMERIQELRECWVGGSKWKDRKVIRISVCSWATTSEDVKRCVASFQQAYRDVA